MTLTGITTGCLITREKGPRAQQQFNKKRGEITCSGALGGAGTVDLLAGTAFDG